MATRNRNNLTTLIRLGAAIVFALGGLGAPSAWAASPAAAQPAPLLSPNPTAAFSAAVYHGFAVAGSLPITVTLSAAPVVTATVDYATSDGSAQAGVDYTALSGTLTFSPGVTSQTLSLPLLSNPLGVADQTLTATLSNPVSATLGAPVTALIVISHDTTTFTVTKSADTADGACELTDCSLREAVIAANTYPGANTIVLPSGTYTLSLAGANEDAAATGDLDVTGDLTLSGVTSATTVITTTGAAFGDRVFQVLPSVAMTATDITVTGGFLQAGNGGGFYSQGQLALARSTMFSNTAAGEGGALYVYTGTVATVDSSQLTSNTSLTVAGAGGIYSAGTLTVTNSRLWNSVGQALHNNQGQALVDRTIISNSSDFGLLNDNGTMVITGSTITRNPGGGARNNLCSGGNGLTVINSLFSENTDNPAAINGAGGGAIANYGSQLTVTNSSFISNSATSYAQAQGGAIWSFLARGVTISHSTFTSNTQGAIYNVGSGIPTYTVSIADSTFVNNQAADSVFLNNQGGAINNTADGLSISNSTFVSNTTSGSGGAVNNSSRWLTIAGSAFYSNTAAADGGAVLNIFAPVTMTNSIFTGNKAGGNGGAIRLAGGPAAMTQLTMVSNTAAGQGGGLYVVTGTQVLIDDNDFAGNQAGYGGAVYSRGVLTITSSALVSNHSDRDGGGINNQGTLVVINSLIKQNDASGMIGIYLTGDGGGIDNESQLRLISDTLSANTATAGGGIDQFDGQIYITDSVLVSNTSASEGGALLLGGPLSTNYAQIANSQFLGNSAPVRGGAIVFQGFGTLTATRTLFSGNQADIGGAIENLTFGMFIQDSNLVSNTANTGGAVFNVGHLWVSGSAFVSNTASVAGGGLYNTGLVVITDSTVSDNRAKGHGGGIYDGFDYNDFNAAEAKLNNVTLAGNIADADNNGTGDGGGLYVAITSTVQLSNSLLSGNQDLGGEAPDCAGALITGGHNLIQSTTGCTLSGTASGDITGTAALLGPMQDNGGPTWTRALLPGSPALDAGSLAAPGSGGGACEAADQRGVARPQGLGCDIGAFEAVELSAIITVQLSSNVYSALQSAGSVPITVTLSQAVGVTVTTQYTTSDGTALTGQNYIAAGGTLTFTAGLTQTTFAVTLLAAAPGAPDKMFGVAILSPTIAVLGTPPTATVTIHNDTPLPSVAFSISQYSVTEGAGTAIMTATLSAQSELTATVHYATSNGTALAGSDYVAANGTLTFTPGLTQTTFTVPITHDALHEADETFGVALSNPISASLGVPVTATVTIVNDDAAPLVRFSSTTYIVTESGAVATIAVTLSAASGLTATVHYATGNGSAAAGSDYTPVSGTLTFAPGQVMQVFSVPITNDSQIEGPETVLLTLSAPAQALLGSPSSATLTIADDDIEYRLFLPMIVGP